MSAYLALKEKEMETARQKRVFSSTTDHKVKFAQYLTPVEIARYMAKTTAGFWKYTDHAAILDAGAGLGILSCCLAGELLNHHRKLTVNYEISVRRNPCRTGKNDIRKNDR